MIEAPAFPIQLRKTQPRPREYKVWGEGLLRRANWCFTKLDEWIGRYLPASLNPIAQTGGLATASLFIATLSGVILLVWYSPSVHLAHSSLEALKGNLLGQFIRSLHRYSSDAAMLMTLVHTARILAAKRFTGSRWFGWVTGIGLLGFLWFLGWTGYWLVWDLRGQAVAIGSAKFVDVLPVFIEPLSRGFLTNEGVHSLIFFMVFFLHMLLPLAMGIVLWLHLIRVNRPKFLPSRNLFVALALSLSVIAILAPATSAAAADMAVKNPRFGMDWWYLWPLAVSSRLSGGMLWALAFSGGLALTTLPWWLARKRLNAQDKAQVNLSRCVGCSRCSVDCPFNAIQMIPREDGRKFKLQASVNPDLCVACGICTGACDSESISVPWINPLDESDRIKAWIEDKLAKSECPQLAFFCKENEGAAAKFEQEGFYTCAVPCVGWLGSQLLERALRNGAARIVIIGCASADPACREGATWLRQRLDGVREPLFEGDLSKIAFLQNAPAEKRISKYFAGILIAAVLGTVTLAISRMPFDSAVAETPELIISFKAKGQALQAAASVSPEELQKLPPHMRRKNEFMQRGRAPVRMRLYLDGNLLLDREYAPRGLSKDAPSIALEKFAVTQAEHLVRVEIFENPSSAEPSYAFERQVTFPANRRQVITFDALTGFQAP